MLKRFGNQSRSSSSFTEEEANPMSGVSNLADAMLVLAVGIMLALVINWKIDVTSNSINEIDTEDLSELTEYDNITDEDISEITSQTGLEEKGSVYVDPDTGKMYVVMPEDE